MLCWIRWTRVWVRRLKSWTIMPRGFLVTDTADGELEEADTLPRGIGGEIFSNVKAGIVCPLVAELDHSWISTRIFFVTGV